LAISRWFFWKTRLLVAIQMAQQQFADWSHLTDALGRMFENNLISFPPTLQNRFGWLLANSLGHHQTCLRGEETRIANQQ
jgi:hypothetical protein